MARIQIAGLLILLAGIVFYFIVEEEPYTTIAGVIAGIGFGALLLVTWNTKKFQRKNSAR